MTTFVLLAVAGFVLAGFAGWLRVQLGPKKPQAHTRPVEPTGGFATADQVRAALSEDAVRRAGAQVRPSLPQQQLPAPKGMFTKKGVDRVRR